MSSVFIFDELQAGTDVGSEDLSTQEPGPNGSPHLPGRVVVQGEMVIFKINSLHKDGINKKHQLPESMTARVQHLNY